MPENTVSLVAKMQVQLNDMQKAMEKAGQIAEHGVKNIERKFAEANPAFSGAAVESVKKLVEALAVVETVRRIREIVKSVAELNDSAERIGVSTTYLQEFQYAVEKTGGSAESASDGLAKLSKGLSQAQAGGGQLLKLFELNNIALKDAHGNLISVADANAKVADLIKNSASAQDALNVATIAYGKGAGPALVNATREGADGLAEQAYRAENLGIIIDDKLVKSTTELNSKFQDLEFQFTSSLKKMAIEAASFASDFNSYFSSVGTTLDGIADSVQSFARNLHDLMTGVAGADLNKLTPSLLLRGGTRFGPLPGTNQRPQALEDFYNAVNYPGAPLHVDMGPTTRVPPPRGTPRAPVRDRAADTIAQLQAELDKVTAIGDERIRLEFEEKKISELRSANVKSTSEEGKKIVAMVDALEEATIKQKHMVELMDQIRDVTSSGLNTLVNDLFEGKSAVEALNDALKNMLSTLLNIAEQQVIRGLFGESGTAGGGFLGPILSSFFGAPTPHQAGGPAQAGRPYLVGEHGPELMVPGTAGTVIPNGALSRGGEGVQINIINQSGAQIQQRQRNQGGRPIIDILVAEMGKRIGGGDFDSAMRGRYGARPIKVR